MTPGQLQLLLALLNILALLLEKWPQAKARFVALTKQLETMVTEGRDPTTEEWEALFADIGRIHDEIQRAGGTS